MARKREDKDRDRHLHLRGETYHYKRHVPLEVAALDPRAPQIRKSLKTTDLALARAKRDQLEAADNELWASMLCQEDQESAAKRHASALARVSALGFRYRSALEVASEPLEERLRRVEAVEPTPAGVVGNRALLGTIPLPKVPITKAFEVYQEEIAAPELRGKSAQQKRKWRNAKRRGVETFVALNGDMDIAEIERSHALTVYRHWLARIAPKEGKPTHTASSGNRDLGSLRSFYAAYFEHLNEPDRINPFAGLSFSETKKKTRPSFPTAFIKDTLMKPGALAGMNSQARGICLAIIETGARPSELCNIEPANIRLDHEVPHIAIEPRDDPDNPRELKTGTSLRLIPLVGVALAVFKKHKDGFPQYREREETLSATVNKYLRENDLTPTSKHTLYSLRHAFEDRMKNAGIGDELRRILMGHSLDRQKYGEGGSLEWRQSELKKIELPFDPSIV